MSEFQINRWSERRAEIVFALFIKFIAFSSGKGSGVDEWISFAELCWRYPWLEILSAECETALLIGPKDFAAYWREAEAVCDNIQSTTMPEQSIR